VVAGSAVELDLLIFDTGVLRTAFPAPHPFSDLTSDMGKTTVTVLQNPTAAAAPSAITDFSTNLTTITTVWGETRVNPCNGSVAGACGTVGGINDPTPGASTGIARQKTPAAAGTYLYAGLGNSLRDTDGDGFENALDTCAETATNMLVVADTATGGSTTTVVDAGASFTAGALVGDDVHILSGAAANTDRAITANTATTITFAPAASSPVASGDGYSVGFNPRRANPANDADSDAIPGGGDSGGCDPTTGTDTGAGNHDGDVAPNGSAWQNAGDNCPLVGNSTQLESELNHTYYEVAATNPAPQGGPKTDAIGDSCDSDDAKANGDYLASIAITAKCYGGTDADDDGYCTVAGSLGADANDPADGSAAVTPESYSLVYAMASTHSGAGDTPPERQPVQVCNDGIDNDGDTLIDNLDHGGGTAAQNLSDCRPSGVPAVPAFPTCPVTGCPEDSDGDGVGDEAERHLGTNSIGRCGVGGISSDPPSKEWPLDFIHAGVPNSTDRIVITDLTSFLAGGTGRKLDTKPGDAAFDVRWDLSPGPAVGSNWIQIGDLTSLFAGTPGFPSMNSGGKVFGTGFVCSAHPTYGK
jgi:hypothetical protein